MLYNVVKKPRQGALMSRGWQGLLERARFMLELKGRNILRQRIFSSYDGVKRKAAASLASFIARDQVSDLPPMRTLFRAAKPTPHEVLQLLRDVCRGREKVHLAVHLLRNLPRLSELCGDPDFFCRAVALFTENPSARALKTLLVHLDPRSAGEECLHALPALIQMALRFSDLQAAKFLLQMASRRPGTHHLPWEVQSGPSERARVDAGTASSQLAESYTTVIAAFAERSDAVTATKLFGQYLRICKGPFPYDAYESVQSVLIERGHIRRSVRLHRYVVGVLGQAAESVGPAHGCYLMGLARHGFRVEFGRVWAELEESGRTPDSRAISAVLQLNRTNVLGAVQYLRTVPSAARSVEHVNYLFELQITDCVRRGREQANFALLARDLERMVVEYAGGENERTRTLQVLCLIGQLGRPTLSTLLPARSRVTVQVLELFVHALGELTAALESIEIVKNMSMPVPASFYQCALRCLYERGLYAHMDYLWEDMVAEDILPDGATYEVMARALSERGRLTEAASVRRAMVAGSWPSSTDLSSRDAAVKVAQT